ELVERQQRFKDQGLQVIGLNVGGPDDWPKVADFARKLKIQYTLAVPDNDLSSFLLSDNQQLPQTFVFDRNGELVKRVVGYTEADGRSEEHTSELQSHRDLHSFPTRRSSDLSSFLLSDNQQLPQTFVFDRNGELVKRVVGYTEADGEQIDQVVRAKIEKK